MKPERRLRLWSGRRRFLLGAGGTLVAAGAAGLLFGRDYIAEGLLNPCLSGVPRNLLDHPLVKAAWEGVRADQVWDCHTHVAGIGADGSGIVIHPDMNSLASPWRHLQKMAYMNAACAENDGMQPDSAFVARLAGLAADMPPGYKVMLLAFDWFHDARGQTVPGRSTFYVPNEYVAKLVAANPQRFEWMASVHPYRQDAVPALEAAAAAGARGVKWLPAAQGMDPSSKQCLPFFDAMARLQLPLLIHCGEEKAVHGGDTQHLGNPLYLRAALERGVKVIVAHCASLGEDVDIDKPGVDRVNGPRVPSFNLFARLMDDKAYAASLFGDISAITQVNRGAPLLYTLLERQDWHARLLNGSDYPLPGIMPLYSTEMMVKRGLLTQMARDTLVEIRRYNPLLYDFVLKRSLCWQGKGFAPEVFMTRRHYPARIAFA